MSVGRRLGRRDPAVPSWLTLVESEAHAHLVSRGTALEGLAAPSGAVLRTSRAHLARAIDQAGATVGLVALEDGPGRSGCFTWNWDVGEWWNLVGRRDRMTHSEARSASWLALVDSEPTAHLVSRGTALEVMASPPRSRMPSRPGCFTWNRDTDV